MPSALQGDTSDRTSTLQDTADHSRHHLVSQESPISPQTRCMVAPVPWCGCFLSSRMGAGTPQNTSHNPCQHLLGSSHALTCAGLIPGPILCHWCWLHVLVGALRLFHAKGCWRKEGREAESTGMGMAEAAWGSHGLSPASSAWLAMLRPPTTLANLRSA